MSASIETTRRRITRPDMQADAVVIGAGISGLVAATVLAAAGAKVVVLERDAKAGGLAGRFSRRYAPGAFTHAVGATLGAGLQPGGVLDVVLRKVGAKVSYHTLDPIMRVHLSDRDVTVVGTWPAWHAELARAFPGQDKRKLDFWKNLTRIARVLDRVAARFPGQPFTSLPDTLQAIRAFEPALLTVLPAMLGTVGGSLQRYGVNDPALTTFMDGQLLDSLQTTSENAVLANGALALDLYRFGAQYVPGGLASIADALAARLKALGGVILQGRRAREIVIERGQVKGVRADRFYAAPVVVSSAGVLETAALAPTLGVSSRHREAANSMWSAFTLYLAVSEKVLPQGWLPFEQITESENGRLRFNGLVSTSLHGDLARAPEGYRSITMSVHEASAVWRDLNPQAYQGRKEAMTASMLSRLSQLAPNLNEGLIGLEAGTPRTFKAFTLHEGGHAGGFQQTPSNANFGAVPTRTNIQGLFLAGETTFPGAGLPGVTVSGFNAARAGLLHLRAPRGLTRRSALSNPASAELEVSA